MSQHTEDDFGQESFASRRQRAFIREKMANTPKEDDFGQENFRGKIRERYEHEEEMPSGSVRGRELYKTRENYGSLRRRRPGYDVQQSGQIATPDNPTIGNRLQVRAGVYGMNGLGMPGAVVRMEPRSGIQTAPQIVRGGQQATVRTNQAGRWMIPSNNADTVASIRAAQGAGATGSSITTLVSGEPFAKKPSQRFMAKKREGMASRGVVRENMGHTGGPPAHIIDHVDEGFRRAAPRSRVMGRQMRERMMVRPAPRKNTMVEQYKNANVKSNMRKQYGL